MTNVQDESKRFGLVLGLITTFYLIMAVIRKSKCCCKRGVYDLENQGYQEMSNSNMKVYGVIILSMYMMALINYLSELIFIVANNKN